MLEFSLLLKRSHTISDFKIDTKQIQLDVYIPYSIIETIVNSINEKFKDSEYLILKLHIKATMFLNIDYKSKSTFQSIKYNTEVCTKDNIIIKSFCSD